MGQDRLPGGNTQIGKVLSEARREAVASAVRAVVFVGDAMRRRSTALPPARAELGLLKGAGIHVSRRGRERFDRRSAKIGSRGS